MDENSGFNAMNGVIVGVHSGTDSGLCTAVPPPPPLAATAPTVRPAVKQALLSPHNSLSHTLSLPLWVWLGLVWCHSCRRNQCQ